MEVKKLWFKDCKLQEQVRLQSWHRTEKGLESYELLRNEEQISMMNEMITNIYDSNIK